jgi:hypothetical protein
MDRGQTQRTRETLKLARMEELLERVRRTMLNATVRRTQKRRERELLADYYVSKDDNVATCSTGSARSNQSSSHSSVSMMKNIVVVGDVGISFEGDRMSDV